MQKKTTRKSSLLSQRNAILTLTLTVLLVSGVSVVFSQTNGSPNTNNTWGKHGSVFMNLTADQQNQLIQTINQLKSSEATPSEIKANITQTLQNFGVNITAPFGFGHFIGRHFGDREFRPMVMNNLILKATDGANCYSVTVNNAGTLSTALVTCP